GEFTDLTDMIDADRLEREVDGCLRRLGVEYIDILHIHAVIDPQYDHVRDVLLPRMGELRQKGKLRVTGITERFASDTNHVMARRAADDALVDVLMIGLNFVNQTAIGPLLAATSERGIGTLCMFAVRGPLARRASAEALLNRLVERGEVDPATFDADDPFG